MTDPQQPPPDEPAEPRDETDALVPALLTVYALYLAWRGAHAGFRGNAAAVERALNLPAHIGGALLAVAQRALGDQRAQAGRAGDEFWTHVDAAARVAAETGMQVLAEALLWTDRRTAGDPSTTDVGGRAGEATVPTASDPPTLLAGMVATAVANAARMAAAELAGWSTKTWETRRDNRVRDAHRALQGQTEPLGSPFLSGDAKLQFPGDPSAPIGLRANCRCWLRFGR